MKFKKFIAENFGQKKLVDETLEQKLIALLPQIFPAEDLKQINAANKINKQDYKAKYLPFNTRNEEWLANFIVKTIQNLQIKLCLDGKKSAYRMLGNVTVDDIKKFMASSVEFNAMREDYELGLVKSYVNLLRDNTRDDFFTVAEEKQAILEHVNCSMLFRNRIVDAMQYLNLPEDVIEVGIEKNRNLWYARMQNHTFANLYEHVPIVEENSRHIYPYLYRDWLKWDNSIRSFHAYWKNLDDYKYYLKHKNVIDKIGNAMPNMKITKAQSVDLIKKTNDKYLEYKRLLNDLTEKINTRIENFINTK